MEYEGRICRAPMERASYMLPVMVGCSYNKCKFCNLFRDLKYRELPLEQVEEELQRVKNLGGNPEKNISWRMVSLWIENGSSACDT